MNMKLLLTVNWVQPADIADHSPAIHCIGGKSGEFQWKHSEEQAIAYIEGGLFEYFVRNDSKNLKLEVAANPNGRKYLKVDADGEVPITRLHLPSHC